MLVARQRFFSYGLAPLLYNAAYSSSLRDLRGTPAVHVRANEPAWDGELRTRPTGSLVADRRGSDAVIELVTLLLGRPGETRGGVTAWYF